ncbi:MAG: hypothetical protein PHP69_03870 [Candidatus Omnitrophica bacterium]|nr:hypothetical protein [Candidatus Omnitrophota bacterium]
MKNKKTKKSWLKLGITKIKLNSEQAVLSCCDSTNRGDYAVATQ